MIFSRNKTKDFAKIKERVLARLESWNGHMLSKAEKMTLIKSVVQAIPTYSIATFKLPDGIYEQMDGAIRKFWWQANQKSQKFMALKFWKNLCKPKKGGVLGFRRFSEMNLALIAKLAWKLATGE